MELLDTFDRLLSETCSPAQIRQLEKNEEHVAIWSALESSGFLDILVPESAGGAGLGWQDAWGVLFAAGRHAVPYPIAQTLFARACLAEGEHETPDGPIALATAVSHSADGVLTARLVQGGLLATHVLLQDHDTTYLLPANQATQEAVGGQGSFDAHLTWQGAVVTTSVIGRLPRETVSHGLALGLAVLIAGASDRILEMTLTYANDRVQFGKPIGRLQAVQQQITEMAERVYGIRMATQLGCQSTSDQAWVPLPNTAALAKSQASAAAVRIANVAHAVHGAIGVTHEYDLQIYTRRLYEWNRAGGGAKYWAARLGRAALDENYLLDFVRKDLFQAV
jgi:alkylation response protein AidB-like acyl-CoA dehydrogenase